MKNKIWFILMVFLTTVSESQIQYGNIDSIFSQLDKTKWSTHILYIGNEPLTNVKDSVINISIFRKYFFEITHNVITDSLYQNLINIDIDSVFTQASIYYHKFKTIPIGIIFIRYNYIKPSAVDSGFITLKNNQMIEQTNDKNKMYGEDTLILLSPLVQEIDTSITYLKTNLEFILTNSYNMQSSYKLYVSMENASNAKTLISNDSVQVQCNSFNNKVKIRLQYLNFSRNFYCSLYSYPFLREMADKIIYVGNTYNNAIGKATIRYGCGNNTNQIKKPFVFVEGFDPIDVSGNFSNYGRLHWEIFSNWNAWISSLNPSDRDLDHDGIWDYQNLQKGKNLVDKLNAEGFDIIYLEFKNSSRDIRENARVLESLLYIIGATQSINTLQPKHKTILAGGSMGGLITRTTINLMENNYISSGIISQLHNIRKWITFDTPFLGNEGLGANIPLGNQFFVDFFGNGLGASSEAQTAVSVLNTTASRQMLNYHYKASSNANNASSGNNAIASASTLYFNFGQDAMYNSIPYYVKTKIGISNGSNKGTNGNQGFGWGAQMVDMISSCSGFPNSRGIGKTWAIPESYTQKIFEGHKQICINFSNISSSENWIHYSLPIDNAPGGNRYTNKSLVFLGGNAYFPAHCFVPTISSLGIDLFYLYLQTGKYDLFYDLRNQIFLNSSINYVPHPNIAYIKSPKIYPSDINPTIFDILYAPDNNQQHVEITDDNINFIMNEISPSDLYLQNEIYPLNNLPSDADQFEARNTITAGKNVTPKTAVGDFVIKPGANITFRAGDKITLKDGFSVKAGATFKAYIDPFPCAPVNRLSSSNTDTKNEPSDLINANSLANTHIESKSHVNRFFNKKLLLIPNPTSSSVIIQTFDNRPIQSILIKDLTGKILLQQNFPAPSNAVTLDVSTLSNGLYLVEVHTDVSVATEKIIVQR